MVDTKPLNVVQKKWEDAIGSVPARYKEGVEGATNWQTKAIEGEGLYAEKVQEAISAKRRASGIASVSDADWKNAAANKGATRIGPGMSASKGKFGRGIADVLNTIQGVQIGPRTADPMANVDNRVKPIVSALAAMKK